MSGRNTLHGLSSLSKNVDFVTDGRRALLAADERDYVLKFANALNKTIMLMEQNKDDDRIG